MRFPFRSRRWAAVLGVMGASNRSPGVMAGGRNVRASDLDSRTVRVGPRPNGDGSGEHFEDTRTPYSHTVAATNGPPR
jgi:hypothetical protein